MAGSDKKEQKLASDESVSSGPALLVVQEPDVSHFVMSGSPVGLIPREKLNTDQTTTITSWGGTIPDGETEYFRLRYARADSDVWTNFQEHTVEGGTTWLPLVFTIPSTFLLDTENEGAFDLRYEHVNFTGTDDHSNRVRIHIDKVPPNGAIPPRKMVFAITPPITDATFGTNDYLEATIPAWTGDQADVQVAFGWMKGELPEDPSDIDLIGPQPIAAGGGTVIIPKDKFTTAGDGLCCGGYVLIDKAGNISRLSEYELMSVALGPLPVAPLGKPTAADATGGELLRSDIVDEHVVVNVPQVPNGKPTDTIVVKWNAREVIPAIPVGSNPAGGINILVPWTTIWAEYGSTTTGVVDTPLSYTVRRGVERYDSAIETLQCNFSSPGPVNPNPEPGNDLLKAVTIVGESGTDNKLIAGDEDQQILAKIELVAPLSDGDVYQVMWNGTPIGARYVIDVANDSVGDVIEIELDWDVIRGEGPSATMPVWYVLSNAAHANPQEPDPRTSVEIDFLVIELPEAVPRHTNTNGIVTCNSLRWNAGNTTYGIEYLIPPSRHLQAGDSVEVEWNAYTNYASPELVTSATKTHTFTNITQEQADNGIVWLIEPYATHVLPTWQSHAPIGKGEVTYTITGKPASSTPTNSRVALSQGEGSCNVPPAPTP